MVDHPALRDVEPDGRRLDAHPPVPVELQVRAILCWLGRRVDVVLAEERRLLIGEDGNGDEDGAADSGGVGGGELDHLDAPGVDTARVAPLDPERIERIDRALGVLLEAERTLGRIRGPIPDPVGDDQHPLTRQERDDRVVPLPRHQLAMHEQERLARPRRCARASGRAGVSTSWR